MKASHPVPEIRYPTAVNTNRHKAAFFQKRKAAFHCSFAAVRSGCHRMVSPWKISQIKGDTGYGFCFCIGCHVLMGIQEQLIILRTVILFQAFFCVFQCLFLNVKCQNTSIFSLQVCSTIQCRYHFHRCINTNISRHEPLPDKMLRVCGDLKIFHTKILSRFFTVHDNTADILIMVRLHTEALRDHPKLCKPNVSHKDVLHGHYMPQPH